jgi:hypothetical protein
LPPGSAGQGSPVEKPGNPFSPTSGDEQNTICVGSTASTWSEGAARKASVAKTPVTIARLIEICFVVSRLSFVPMGGASP